MKFIPAFIVFLLGIYSQVGPGSGIQDLNPYSNERFNSGRHLLETTTTETPPADDGFFSAISTFYSNKNNMAMYLVLPIIVLLYGGCSSIYCIAKCRRYLRKRKHQKMTKHDDEEKLTQNEPNNLNQDAGNENHTLKTANNINTSSTDVSLERENSTPLPWQVPDDTTTALVHQNRKASPSNHRIHSSALDPDSPISSDKNQLLQINRPPIPAIPLEVIPRPTESDEIPKRILPPGQKTSKSLFPPIDQPSPVGQNAPIRHVDSIEDMPLKHRSKSPNALIEAALRPSSTGRDSVSTIAMKDELLARFDAFSTFAMAKKAADILRVNSMGGDKKQYVKPKNKLIFIAE